MVKNVTFRETRKSKIQTQMKKFQQKIKKEERTRGNDRDSEIQVYMCIYDIRKQIKQHEIQ